VLKSRVLQLLPPNNAIRELILGEEDFLPFQDYLVKAECWARLIQAQGAEFGWAQAVHREEARIATELEAHRIVALNLAEGGTHIAVASRSRSESRP
jgi:hypothetical protein